MTRYSSVFTVKAAEIEPGDHVRVLGHYPVKRVTRRGPYVRITTSAGGTRMHRADRVRIRRPQQVAA